MYYHIKDRWKEGTIKVPFSYEIAARNYRRKIRAAPLLALEVPCLLTNVQRQKHFSSLLQAPPRLCGGNKYLNCCTPVNAYTICKTFLFCHNILKTFRQLLLPFSEGIPHQNHNDLPKLRVDTSLFLPSPPLQSDKPLFKEQPKPSKHIPWPSSCS